jgi:GNAT superfamily N-acetyltransferase
VTLEITRYPADKVPKRLHDTLWRLSLQDRGQMWDVFEDILRAPQDRIDFPDEGYLRGVVYLAKQDTRYVGWALRFKRSHDPYWTTYVYVDEKKRRNGIGSKLMGHSVRYLKGPCHVEPHSTESREFFTHQIKVKKLHLWK